MGRSQTTALAKEKCSGKQINEEEGGACLGRTFSLVVRKNEKEEDDQMELIL